MIGSLPTPLADSARAIGALSLFLLVCIILMLAVLLGWILVSRMTRRHRAPTGVRSPKRTPAGDVWAMHKLPPDSENPDCAESDDHDDLQAS